MGSVRDVANDAGGHPRLEHAMIERIGGAAPQSGAEALKALRSAFPESPLSERVGALVMLARQQNGRSASR